MSYANVTPLPPYHPLPQSVRPLPAPSPAVLPTPAPVAALSLPKAPALVPLAADLLAKQQQPPQPLDVLRSNRFEPRPLTLQPPSTAEKLTLQAQALNPKLKQLLSENLQGSGERLADRQLMYLRLNNALKHPQRKQLNAVLEAGMLTDTSGDDPHSTLYHLYKLYALPRAEGLDGLTCVAEALALLQAPHADHQDFAPLDEATAQQMLQALNHPSFDKHQQQAPPTPRRLQDLLVTQSNTCAAASQMSRLASRSQKEFVRMLEQASSPNLTIYEQATPHELSPEAPAMAEELLRSFNLQYHKLPNGTLLVEYPVPRLGYLRAVNAQQNPTPNASSGMEALFQTTMVYNSAKKTYDPATDQRDALDLAQVAVQNSPSLTEAQKQQLFELFDQPRADDIRKSVLAQLPQYPNLSAADRQAIALALFSESVGLTEDERTLMERVMEDGEAMTPVTYQITGPKANADRSSEGRNYLYGYTRTFAQIEQDLTTALDQGRELIIGITFSDEGELPGGHILKVQGYQHNAQTGELEFLLADSDDDKDSIDIRPASELIPMIHHAGLPYQQAKAIWQELKAKPGQYYVPDESDWQHYDRFPVLREPVPEGVPMPEPLDAMIVAYQQEQLQKQQLQQQQQQQTARPSLAVQPPPYTAWNTLVAPPPVLPPVKVLPHLTLPKLAQPGAAWPVSAVPPTLPSPPPASLPAASAQPFFSQAASA